MHRLRFAAIATLASLGLALGAAQLDAQLTYFDADVVGFQAATNTSIYATFESATQVNQSLSTYTEGGLTFEPLPGGDPLYIATPDGAGAANFTVPIESNVLTGNGDEEFFFAFSAGPNSYAIGFDVYTNNYTPAPTISLYGTSDNLLGSIELTQAPSTLGFFGVTSTAPIGRVEFVAVGGAVKNTGIDNVRLGSVVPEPASVLLLASGLLGLGLVARRRKRASLPE